MNSIRNLIKVSIALVLLLLSACAIVNVQDFYEIKSNVGSAVEQPSKDTARIVFFRPNQSFTNSYWMLNIVDGNKSIGVLPISSYFIYDTEPGEHVFGAFFDAKVDFLKADVAGGKIYFVRAAYLDKYFKQIARILPAKPGTDIMLKKDEEFSTFQQVGFNDKSREVYKVNFAATGAYMQYKLVREVRVEFEQLRNKWLSDKKQQERPMLLPEDGL